MVVSNKVYRAISCGGIGGIDERDNLPIYPRPACHGDKRTICCGGIVVGIRGGVHKSGRNDIGNKLPRAVVVVELKVVSTRIRRGAEKEFGGDVLDDIEGIWGGGGR